jgi:hypothetical protein
VSDGELEVGSILAGQFRILARLGAGGMGELYLADQFAVERKVAIKVVHGGLAQLHPSVLERFKREARALAQVNHPNVVHLYAFGETERRHPFLAMEFVPGSSLESVLAKGALERERALRNSIKVAEALRETHRRDVVHRDLKPANIMLADDDGGGEVVKLVDFGIAKELDETANLTKPGALFGTPQYMPPEQARGQQVDGRTDIYALGIVLYEMLTGASPFSAKTPYDFIAQHLTAKPEPPSRKRLHVPASVDAIVMRCLEKEPGNRFASADALAAALEAALRDWKAGGAKHPAPIVYASEESYEPNPFPDEAVAVTGSRPIVRSNAAPAAVAAQIGRGALRVLRLWPWAIWLIAMAYFLPQGVLTSLLATLSSATRREAAAAGTRSEPAANDAKPSWVAYAGAALGNERQAVAGYTRQCLNRFTARAVDSYARYVSWADPERGPSGKSVRGVYSLYDPGLCLGHIQQAELAAPEALRKPAGAYAAALTELTQRLKAAENYYETEGYKDDGFAKGRELHLPLMRAFHAYFGADRPLRAALGERLEQTQATAASSALDRVRSAVRHLSLLANDAGRDLARIDFASELDVLDKSVDELEDAPSLGSSCNNVSNVHGLARQFLVTAKQLQRALRGAKQLPPAGLVEKGNAVLRAYNACTMTRGEPVELELVQLPAARVIAP